jgi:repressor LexA
VRDRDLQVITFIRDFISDHGFAPTYREIAAGVTMPSTATVKRALDRLQAAGLVARDPGRQRTITLRTVASDA